MSLNPHNNFIFSAFLNSYHSLMSQQSNNSLQLLIVMQFNKQQNVQSTIEKCSHFYIFVQLSQTITVVVVVSHTEFCTLVNKWNWFNFRSSYNALFIFIILKLFELNCRNEKEMGVDGEFCILNSTFNERNKKIF